MSARSPIPDDVAALITAYALGVKLVPGVWAPPAVAVLLP